MSFPIYPSPLSFPKEAYFKRNYTALKVDLDVKPKYITVVGDYITVITALTTADTTKVYIGFNQEPVIPLSEVQSGVETPFTQITLSWENSETGKVIWFLIGQEAKFIVSRQGVVVLNQVNVKVSDASIMVPVDVQGDLVGLAKDATLNTLISKFTNVSKRCSITASSNTGGLTCDLQVDHRSVLEVWVSCGGACSIEVYGGIDSSNYRKLDVQSLTASGEWSKGYLNAFPYIRVKVPTTSINVTIEITANP